MDISKYGKERKKRIAKRLRDEREAKIHTFEDGEWKGQTVHGLTQDQLAYEIRSTRQTVGTWEKEDGKNKIPNPDQILALCSFYDCDYGYLICEYDTRKHEIADIQDQTGLSEQALNVLRKAKIITDGHIGILDDMLGNGIISIEDYERKKAQTYTMTLRIINNFIENCGRIVSSLGSIDTFRKDHDFYNHFHAIEDVRKAFDTIYNADAPGHYGQWLDFLNEVRPLFSNGETKDEMAEDMITDQIYEIWIGLIEEKEHQTENQHRYAITQEWENIVDLTLNEF